MFIDFGTEDPKSQKGKKSYGGNPDNLRLSD
jgi:hypothetical protein